MNIKIHGFDNSCELTVLVKITKIKDRAINSYLKLGHYYPIVKKDNAYSILHNNGTRDLSMGYRVFSWLDPERTFRDIERYVECERIYIRKYDRISGHVVTSDSYEVELI